MLSLSPSHLLFVTPPDGARIASSTGIDVLLLDHFQLVINDTTHLVRPPRRGENKLSHRRGRSMGLGSSRLDSNRMNKVISHPARPNIITICKSFPFPPLLCRGAASRGGREAERCQVSGATALHHFAHRRAPAQQRAGADRTTGGPQLSTPSSGEGPKS